MSRLAIFGASGHGKVVADAALLSMWTEVVFYDDRWPAVESVGPWAVIGTLADLATSAPSHDGVVVAIGDNRTRLTFHRELARAGGRLATVVHPAAVISPYARVGPGSVICAAAVVNPFAQLGAACIVNTGATVDHDVVLSDGVHVSPGANLGGAVRVGEASWIGIGAAVRQSCIIGARVIVGAGAAVVADIEDDVTVVGVPARDSTLLAKS